MVLLKSIENPVVLIWGKATRFENIIFLVSADNENSPGVSSVCVLVYHGTVRTVTTDGVSSFEQSVLFSNEKNNHYFLNFI